MQKQQLPISDPQSLNPLRWSKEILQLLKRIETHREKKAVGNVRVLQALQGCTLTFEDVMENHDVQNKLSHLFNAHYEAHYEACYQVNDSDKAKAKAKAFAKAANAANVARLELHLALMRAFRSKNAYEVAQDPAAMARYMLPLYQRVVKTYEAVGWTPPPVEAINQCLGIDIEQPGRMLFRKPPKAFKTA